MHHAVDRAAGDEHPLRLRDHRKPFRVGRDDALEQVVEGDDRTAQQAAAAGKEIALDPVDVRPVRHDQEWLVVEARQIALQQERDFARICRPRNEAQPHRAMVRAGADGLFAPEDWFPLYAGTFRRSPSAGARAAPLSGPGSCPRSHRRDPRPSSRDAHP